MRRDATQGEHGDLAEEEREPKDARYLGGGISGVLVQSRSARNFPCKSSAFPSSILYPPRPLALTVPAPPGEMEQCVEAPGPLPDRSSQSSSGDAAVLLVVPTVEEQIPGRRFLPMKVHRGVE
mmetsp:Transcript_38271/g.114587  ORF Transcript_38271/g.114587 Transcript_38271/m.114587 type:complete len:123 (+) Transcript_38271:1154-1522(+)